jgi:diguanylate cyclase (GGDEF)-like protein
MQYDNLIHHHSEPHENIMSEPTTVQVGFPERFEGPRHKEAVLIGARAVGVLVESQKEARTDALTGLPNKRAFEEGLKALVEVEQYSDEPNVALVYFDLDNFKMVNDDKENGGHEAGDRVLEIVAQILQNRLGLRQREIVARIGGDEFAAALITKNVGNSRRKSITADEILNGFIERIEKDVEKLAHEIGMPWLGVSAGIVKYQKGESAEDFRDRADKAMYEIKEKRKANKAIES